MTQLIYKPILFSIKIANWNLKWIKYLYTFLWPFADWRGARCYAHYECRQNCEKWLEWRGVSLRLGPFLRISLEDISVVKKHPFGLLLEESGTNSKRSSNVCLLQVQVFWCSSVLGELARHEHVNQQTSLKSSWAFGKFAKIWTTRQLELIWWLWQKTLQIKDYK